MDVFDEKSEYGEQDELMDEIEDIYTPVKAQASVPLMPTKFFSKIQQDLNP